MARDVHLLPLMNRLLTASFRILPFLFSIFSAPAARAQVATPSTTPAPRAASAEPEPQPSATLETPTRPAPRTLPYVPPPVPRDSEGDHDTNLNDAKLLHGFRLGYSYTSNFDKSVPSLGGKSFADKTDTRTPSHFLVGYEAFYRMVGHSWLNVILVANANVAGMEQAKFLPSGNFMIGAELDNSFQIGIGVHLEPLAGSEAHMITAAGWTPRVGKFYVPIHAFFIPDVDGVHRTGVTTGVTW